MPDLLPSSESVARLVEQFEAELAQARAGAFAAALAGCAALACCASLANAAGLAMANSDRLLRSSVMPAVFRPLINVP